MKYITKLIIVVAVGISISLVLAAHVALAVPIVNSTVGCVLREQGTSKFVVAGKDKNSIGEIISAASRRGIRIIDPCLIGQVKDMRADVYASLVERHPEKFEPILQPLAGLHRPVHKPNRGIPEFDYVWLDPILTNEVAYFSPVNIINDGKIYGDIYDQDFNNHVGFLKDGAFTIVSEGVFGAANNKGLIGGYIIIDPEQWLGQAAIFSSDGIELIPRVPGEIHSQVSLLNDKKTVVVWSLNKAYEISLAVYRNGVRSPLDFGPSIPTAYAVSMNNRDEIAGFTETEDGLRGFRYNINTGGATILEPQAGESESWAWGINNNGDVAGYSYISGGIERIGVWDRHNRFHTYFLEGTPEVPTISNYLLINDKNEIVISDISAPAEELRMSYIIPKPGVRVDLASKVQGLPNGNGLWIVYDINDHADMLGYSQAENGSSQTFLLNARRKR